MTEHPVTDERITLWSLFLDVHSAITQSLGRELEAAAGITLTWFDVMLRIARSPGRSLRMTELAELISFSSGGFSKLADRMEAAGLIERSPVAHDRRAWELTLTRRGSEVLDKAMSAHVPGIERHLTGPLEPGQRDDLEQILRRLRTAAMPRQRQR